MNPKRTILMRMLLALTLCPLFLLFYAESGVSQVITPSFDPGQVTILPMTTGRRLGSAIAVGYLSGSGDSDSPLFEEIRDINESRSDLTIALVSADFSLEGNIFPTSTLEYEDASTDGYRRSGWSIMASLVGENIALGASKVYCETDYPDREKRAQCGHFGFGLALRFWEWFQIGGGRNRAWENESDQVKNIWVDYYLGAALQIGKPGDWLLRLEVSQMDSPRTSSSDKGTPGTAEYLAENIHEEVNTSSQTVEILFDELFLSLAAHTSTKATEFLPAGYSQIAPTNTKTIRYGIGLIPQEGWFFTLYQTTRRKNTDYTETNGSKTRRVDEVKHWYLALGFLF